ncbi:hypothetical protein [uncultured Streptococcus sp.]|uniref:hypothetical protein n=1 Tax=uncultured Streptococcus sp. TaxID=83427 RepID=UPI00265E0C09|nr:hypothetical protein [uncultured Streptococcus sp.]
MRRFNAWPCFLALLAVCFIGCIMDTTVILHLLSSVKVNRCDSNLDQIETSLHLAGSLLCTELTVEY